MKTIKRIIQSYRVLKKYLPDIKDEYQDLHGVTRIAIREIIEIW